MAKPNIIVQIETRLGLSLSLAPTLGHDPVRNVMACNTDPYRENKWQLQYALHPDGALAGLNLAGLGLHYEDWQNIAWLLDLSRLEALNLRGNALDAMTINMTQYHKKTTTNCMAFSTVYLMKEKAD